MPAADGALASAELLVAIAERFGTPSYVYDQDGIEARVRELREAFASGAATVEVGYAMKANPNPALVRRMAGLVDGLDVSSVGEVRSALAAGFAPERLRMTGPAKGEGELACALETGLGAVVVESADEARLLDRLARERDTRARVLVRVAPAHLPPGFGVRLAGKPTPFGIDEEEAPEALGAIGALEGLELVGLHAFSGTQCLAADAVSANLENQLAVFARLAEGAGLAPELLVLGAGFGVAHHEGEEPLELGAVAARVAPAIEALAGREPFRRTRFVLETGRFLVGEFGVYLVRVVRIKRSRGTDIAICDGGMHHHLAAAGHLGSLLPRNYRLDRVGAPRGPRRTYDVAGPLCTSIDKLGRAVELDELAPGDLVAVRASGAYGATASPLHFLGHDPPREILVRGADRELVDATAFGR